MHEINMQKYQLISTDLYHTLVYVDIETTWKAFLKEKYTDELARRYWDMATVILMDVFDSFARNPQPFKNCRTMFRESYALLFKQINLDFNPEEAAGILSRGHRNYHEYPDTRLFLNGAGSRCPLCLSSDCDLDMIEGIERLYPFDAIFASEILGIYKCQPAFFRQVISHYGVRAENILHIGDSKTDILGAGQHGIKTCWINRGSKPWDHEQKPDYEVKSLLQVLDILI